MDVFNDFHRVGVTTLVATHDEDLMAQYAKRVFVIEPGRFRDFKVEQKA